MSQLQTKFIQDNAVTDIKMRLRNNLALRARNAADSADIEILKISNTDLLTILREMSMDSNKISGLAAGTNPNDAVNLSQVEALVSGLTDPKDSCRAATTAALPASTYANGTNGVGATLTANANGAFPSQDSVALSVGDRLLVKNQATALQNGIYELTQLGDAGNPWILTRATDANIGSADAADPDNDPNVVSQGMFTQIAEGATNATNGYILTTSDPIQVGVTALNFARLGATLAGGQGIDITNDVVSVDIGTVSGLGFNGSDQLIILVDDALTTGTTKIGAGNVLFSRKSYEETFTLNGTDITNQYVDLTRVASDGSVQLFPRSGIRQKAAVDFTVSLTGGAGGKTRVTFAGDLATGGSAELEAGDIVDVAYLSLDF